MSEMATTDDHAIVGSKSGGTHRAWPAPGRLLLGVGLAMLAILVLVTLLAPLIAPYDPSATSPNSLEGSSAQHWLGTDAIGRDVLSRILVGGRTTLFDHLHGRRLGPRGGARTRPHQRPCWRLGRRSDHAGT